MLLGQVAKLEARSTATSNAVVLAETAPLSGWTPGRRGEKWPPGARATQANAPPAGLATACLQEPATSHLAPTPASTMLKSVRQLIISLTRFPRRSMACPAMPPPFALTPAQQPRPGSRTIVAILRAAAPAGIREIPHSKHTPITMTQPDGITRLSQGWTWSPSHDLRARWRRWRLDRTGLFEAARDRDMYQTWPLRAA